MRSESHSSQKCELPDHYEITAEELTILIERIVKLQAIAEKLCQQKIASFDVLTADKESSG